MRLLFVSHSFPVPGRPLANVGGMQRVATELFEALGRHPRVDLSALVLRSDWADINRNTALFLPRVWWHIRQKARRREVEAVLFSSMVTATTAILLRPVLHRQGVVSANIAHGQDVTLPTAVYQRLVPRVFAAVDAVLPVSRATGEACLQRGLAPAKLHVVPNGVNLARFRPLEPKSAMRHALQQALGLSLPDEVLLLCSVGRQVKRKGFAWFIDTVMPRLPDTVQYWLAGDGPEGDHIRAAIDRQGLGGRVRLLGRISDAQLEALYRGADLFVMPNIPVPGDMEGFGVVMLEAGMGGLPSIAARLEGILDVVAEGHNGHLLASGDADGFRQTILAYWHDRERLARAAQAAYQYTVETFGWDAVANRYVETLEMVRRTRIPVRETP